MDVLKTRVSKMTLKTLQLHFVIQVSTPYQNTRCQMICSYLCFHHRSSNGVASMGPELCWCSKLISEDAGRPFNTMLHVEQKCNTVFGAAMGRLGPIGKPCVRQPLHYKSPKNSGKKQNFQKTKKMPLHHSKSK